MKQINIINVVLQMFLILINIYERDYSEAFAWFAALSYNIILISKSNVDTTNGGTKNKI